MGSWMNNEYLIPNIVQVLYSHRLPTAQRIFRQTHEPWEHGLIPQYRQPVSDFNAVNSNNIEIFIIIE